MAGTPTYKFVELSVVTAEALEEAVNEWVGRGWHLEGIRFVVGEASRRPQMAFVSFVREGERARARAPVPARSELRRKHEILELGELDPGELEPFEAELDWASARRRRGAAADPPKGAPTAGAAATGRRRRAPRA
jgi:hypothetical protein